MSLVFNLQGFIEQCLREITPGINTDKVVLEPTKDPSHGDLASNAAMVCAKGAGMSPRDLAALIIQKIQTNPVILKSEIAGPGFINLTLKSNYLQILINFQILYYFFSKFLSSF